MRLVLFTTAFTAVFFLVATLPFANVRAAESGNRAYPPAANGATRILLLQDGGVLSGQITREKDWYTVSRDGGQMQIAPARVMQICQSMEEVYQYRRQHSSTSNAAAHLELADWCLRYNLLADAGRELTDARRLDPYHPRVALLERRLAKANEQPTTKAGTVSAASATLPPPKSSPLSATAKSDVPDGALELFARKVQPILVNSCTTSGCHQPGGSQSFQLDRAILRGENNRRSTMHNLEAVLALVDREHPEKSPLLTIPHQRHGGMTSPIFGPRLEPAFKHLADWVALVVPPAPADAPAAGVEELEPAAFPSENGQANPAGSPIQWVVKPEIKLAADEPTAADQMNPAPPPQTPLPVTTAAATNETPTLRTRHQLKYGARLQSWQPRDPFDAEIFNRMQRARANAPAEAAPTTVEPKR